MHICIRLELIYKTYSIFKQGALASLLMEDNELARKALASEDPSNPFLNKTFFRVHHPFVRTLSLNHNGKSKYNFLF